MYVQSSVCWRNLHKFGYISCICTFHMPPWEHSLCPTNCFPTLLLSSSPLCLHLVRLFSISARTTGDLVYLLSFFGNQSCRNHTLPTLRHPWNPPSLPLAPHGLCLPLPRRSWRVWWGRRRRDGVRVCVHMEMCLAELVTENEQRSRRCWFVLQQGPPHLIRPQSQHTVWHDTNTAYGNETCIWLQLGAMWPSLHKSPALRRATFEGGL